jgi:hypothetical protein
MIPLVLAVGMSHNNVTVLTHLKTHNPTGLYWGQSWQYCLTGFRMPSPANMQLGAVQKTA